MSPDSCFRVFLWVTVASLLPIFGQGASHTKLVLEGDSAGGSNTFHAPTVPRALLKNGAAIYHGSSTGTTAFFSARPGNVTPLVTLTTPVPGPGNRIFTDIDGALTASYAVNRRGDLVFFARTRVPDVSGTGSGLFLRTANGVLHRLAHDGDAAPGGSFYDDVYFGGQPSISNNGQHVVFSASLFGAPGMAIYHATITGNSVDVQRIAYLSGPAPDGGTWESFQPFINVRGMRAVNDSGLIVFSADTTLSEGSSHVYAWNNGTITEVPGSIWTEQLMLNNAGQIVMQRSSGTGSNIRYTFGTTTATQVIVREGDAAPGGTGTFGPNFGKPMLNEAGQVAFSAGNIVGPFDSGMFLWSASAGLKAVVRTSTLPPGGGIYSHFSTVYDNPQLSETGHVYFLNELTDNSFNRYPTIFMGNGETLVRVIGKGDALEGDLVSDLDFALRVADDDIAENLANHGPVNERGQLVYWAELNTSSKEGLFRYNPEFPEPDIALEQPAGTPLSDGGTLAYGSVVNGGSRVLSVRILNTGDLDLTQLSAEVEGANADQFILGSLAVTTLAGDAHTSLHVQFLPTSLGAKTAVLSIRSNDPDESPFTVTLTGTSITTPVPTVGTLAATNIQATTVTLNGSVDAKGSARQVFFDYGPSTAFGNTIAAVPSMVNDTVESSVSVALTDLLPHTKYHFRVRVVSLSGVTSGTSQSFTTINRSPTVANDSFDILPGGKRILALFDNDNDPDGEGEVLSVAAFTALTPASAGSLTKVGNTLVFTASSSFNGASFTYSAKDAFTGVSGAATVTLNLVSCTLTPPQANIASAGFTYPILISGSGAWAATENLPWLSVIPAFGVGGEAIVIVQPNTGLNERSGTINIGGQTHSIRQAGVLLPALTPPPIIPPAIVGGYYELLVPTTHFPVVYTVTKMPPGLSLNPNTGLISGIPTQSGSYDMTVQAKNAKGSAANPLSFRIVVDHLKVGVLGTFHGIVDPHDTLNGNLGSRLELTTLGTGAFTGKIVTGSTSIPLKGRLSADPSLPNYARCYLTIPRKNSPSWILDLTLSHDGHSILGTVGDGTGALTNVRGWRNTWTSSNRATAYAGLYTFSLTPDHPGDTLPQGHGFGSFKLASETTGTVTVAGKLADGNAFTSASFVGANGQLLVYQALYTGRGSLAGQLQINLALSASDNVVVHELSWLKPSPLSSSRDLIYRNGFGPAALHVDGGLYPVLPAGGVVLGLPNQDQNAYLSFAKGGLETAGLEFNHQFTIRNPTLTGKTQKVTLSSNSHRLTLPTLNVTTGAFGGSFTLLGPTAASHRTVAYQGLMVKSSLGFRGYGYFLLPTATPIATAPKLSGRVLLRDVP